MKVLVNEEATFENILNAFYWLANVSDSEDIVVFYYFGHGTEINDDDGDEDDGYDEALIGWECNLKACITDDMLSELLDNITAEGMAIVLDCCLSDELIDNQLQSSSQRKLSIYQDELSNDISENDRVILTSAYGDGLSLAIFGIGSICSLYLSSAVSEVSFMFLNDDVLTAEEIFQFAKIETTLFYSLVPIIYGCYTGLFAGLCSRWGGILRILNPLDFFKGFIRGFIIGFLFWVCVYLVVEYRAYTETGHWVIPIPQLYDGYKGILQIAYV